MKIQKDHLNKFYEILEKINKKFPLDIDNIKDIIENKLRFHFLQITELLFLQLMLKFVIFVFLIFPLLQ
jgi:hypothetical protein